MIRELFLRDVSLSSCVWQSTIFIVVGLVGSFILRNRSSRAHQVLFLAMIAAVIVPIMSILVKHYELGMFAAEPVAIQSPAEDLTGGSNYGAPGIISAENIERKPGPIEEILPSTMAVSESAEFPWRSVVLYAWIAASLILATRLLVTFVLGVRLLGRALPLDCQRIEEALHLARAKLGIDKDVMVRSSRGVRSPVIWCWKRRPVLLVPSAAGRFDNGIDWAGVLCHELAHWKRRDHISGLLAELVVCILPWHPLLWWAKSRLVRLSEQACDDWVVATGQPGTDYAESLLNLTPGGQMAFVPAVVSSKKGLADRVRRILKDNCGNPSIGALWALTVSIVTAFLTIGVACAQTRPAKTETATEHEAKPTKSLHQAARDGDIEQVKLLISSGADINAKDKFGMTPLYLSLINRLHKDVAKLLLDKGANPNTTNKNNATLLHQWAWGGDPSITKSLIEFLVSKGADVNALQGESRWTPLHSACSRRRGSVAKVLIDNGADVNAKDKWGYTPLHYAILNDDVELAKLLVNNGADFNAKDLDGWTAFRYAVSGGNRGLLDFLAAKGANASDFHLAAWLGDLNRVKHFVEQGTDVNTKDDELNWTPLHWVAFTGQQDVVLFLLTKGASVNVKDEFNTTPMHHAAVAGHRELVELFLAKGAEVNTKDDFGKTPLHSAVKKDRQEVVALLIASGADVNAKYPDGRTSLHRAAEKGYKEVAELLITKGASVSAKDDNGQTPLHLAANRGYRDVAELLIANSAGVNARNQWNRTPLHIAIDRGHTEIVELLRKHGAKE